MRKIILAVLLLSLNYCFAQESNEQKYAAMITGAGLEKQLTVIAGPEMEGRETGTEGQRKAAAFIEAHFKSIGLIAPTGLTGYQQMYPLHQDSLTTSTLTIGGLNAVYESDFIIPRANAAGSFKSKKVIFAGYGIEDKLYNDYEGLDVKGKVVVIFLGEPKKDGNYIITGTKQSSDWTFPGIGKKVALAASKGAEGVLLINQAQEGFSAKMVDDSKKSTLYYPRKSTEKMVNYASVSQTFAKSLMAASFENLLKKAKASEAFSSADAWNKKAKTTFVFDKFISVVNASNVIGVVEGSDEKDEFVFVTAHYDHLGKRNGKIYYGADDDGSGTVAVMEMASAFVAAKAAGHGPRRTLVFMTVSGEEKGLWGSEYYSDNPVFSLDKTTVDLNIDMIGRIDTERQTADSMNYVYVVGHNKLSSDLPVINEGVNTKFTGLVLDYKFDDPKDPERIYFRSDHYNFARKGVPVLFFYDGMLKADYHKPTDTVDKINWPLFEKRARMIFHTAWEMANRDNMLKRDIPLGNETR